MRKKGTGNDGKQRSSELTSRHGREEPDLGNRH